MKYPILLCLTGLLAAALGGCSQPAAVSAPESLTGADAQTLLAAAERVLGQMYFVMDKYDVEAGYLRTRPQRGSQFFEPWRQDNASAAAFAQANLDSLRRTVEVFVEPHQGAASLRCAVTVEKLALPPQPVRSMSQLAEMYTDGSRTLQSLAVENASVEQMEWMALEPDHALEHRIMNRIQQHLKKG